MSLYTLNLNRMPNSLRLVIIAFTCLLLGTTFLKFGTLKDAFAFNSGMLLVNESLTKNSSVRNATLEKAYRRFSGIKLNEKSPVNQIFYIGYTSLLLNDSASSLQTWKLNQKVVIRLLDLGDAEFARENFEQAEHWYDLVLLIDEDIRDGWFYKGLISYQRGDISNALSSFEEASSKNSGYQIGLSDALFRQGQIHHTHFRDYEQAINYFLKAVASNDFRMDGTNAEALYRIGLIKETYSDELIQSLFYYQRALDLNPKHFWAHLQIGKMYYYLYGDLPNAETHIRSAINLWPKDESLKQPHISLGDIYFDAMLNEKAIQEYQIVLGIDPSDIYSKEKLDLLRNK